MIWNLSVLPYVRFIRFCLYFLVFNRSIVTCISLPMDLSALHFKIFKGKLVLYVDCSLRLISLSIRITCLLDYVLKLTKEVTCWCHLGINVSTVAKLPLFSVPLRLNLWFPLLRSSNHFSKASEGGSLIPTWNTTLHTVPVATIIKPRYWEESYEKVQVSKKFIPALVSWLRKYVTYLPGWDFNQTPVTFHHSFCFRWHCPGETRW